MEERENARHHSAIDSHACSPPDLQFLFTWPTNFKRKTKSDKRTGKAFGLGVMCLRFDGGRVAVTQDARKWIIEYQS